MGCGGTKKCHPSQPFPGALTLRVEAGSRLAHVSSFFQSFTKKSHEFSDGLSFARLNKKLGEVFLMRCFPSSRAGFFPPRNHRNGAPPKQSGPRPFDPGPDATPGGQLRR